MVFYDDMEVASNVLIGFRYVFGGCLCVLGSCFDVLCGVLGGC